MKFERGLTLVELMIGIAVFAILVSVAVPQFSELMRRQELNSQVGVLKSALAYARNEAIARGKNVLVCGTADGSACAAKDWSAGWLVFVEEDSPNETGFGVIGANDTVLKRAYKQSTKLSVISDSNLLHYNEAGEAAASVSLSMCTDNAKSGDDILSTRLVSINNVGSIRVEKGLGSSCTCCS